MVSISVGQSNEKMKINGYVFDKESGEAMPYANVLVKDSPWGTMTNSDGYFALDGIPRETVSLMVTYIGYEPITNGFTVEQIEKGPLLLQISPRALKVKQLKLLLSPMKYFSPAKF